MATLTSEQLAMIQADLDQLKQFYKVDPEHRNLTTIEGIQEQLTSFGDGPGIVFWMRVKTSDPERGVLVLEVTKLNV